MAMRGRSGAGSRSASESFRNMEPNVPKWTAPGRHRQVVYFGTSRGLVVVDSADTTVPTMLGP